MQINEMYELLEILGIGKPKKKLPPPPAAKSKAAKKMMAGAQKKQAHQAKRTGVATTRMTMALRKDLARVKTARRMLAKKKV